MGSTVFGQLAAMISVWNPVYSLQESDMAITFQITVQVCEWMLKSALLSVCEHTAEHNRQALVLTLTDDYFISTLLSAPASHL